VPRGAVDRYLQLSFPEADKTGEEMPDWIADKKRRAERIREAKAELEAEAKAAAEAKLKAAAEAQERRDAEGRRKGGRNAAPPRARCQSTEELHRSGKPDHEEVSTSC
jgi:hypothetical protein